MVLIKKQDVENGSGGQLTWLSDCVTVPFTIFDLETIPPKKRKAKTKQLDNERGSPLSPDSATQKHKNWFNKASFMQQKIVCLVRLHLHQDLSRKAGFVFNVMCIAP